MINIYYQIQHYLFGGAYLDKVENNPHTYIHRSFLKEHCMEMIPYNNWKIEDWDENSEER